MIGMENLGAWNYSVLYSGLNLLKIAVDDTLGRKYEGPEYYSEKDGSIWYNISYDLGTSMVMNRRIGDGEHVLTFKEWKKSLGKNHFEAVWDIYDIKPFLYSIIAFAKKGI